MGSLINRFRRDDEGAALVEYGNACGPDRRNLRGGRHKSRDRNKHSFQQHRERPFRNLTSSGVARLPSRAAAGCPLNELLVERVIHRRAEIAGSRTVRS